MKSIKYLIFAIRAICLASCGGKKEQEEESIVLTPETTHIKGDLGDYFEVVDKKYTVTDNWGDMVSVEVKRTSEKYSFNLKGVEPYGTYGQGVTGNAGFGIEILDENGSVIEKVAATASGLGGMYYSDDMKEALKLREGETCTVRWSFHFNRETKPTSFRLSSAFEETDNSNWSSSSNSSDDEEPLTSEPLSFNDDNDSDLYSSTSSSSEDWDALLDSYEQYADKYISYMKKAANGDMSALSEYPSLMQNAQDFSEKRQNAEGDMSTSQWARYMKITNKMTQAATNM